MGKLIRLELFNFKSYKGHHVLLLGDSYFTSIIGPNGSGKSNSMDAISFVLGIKSSHLRSAHLKDLVFRGRVLRTSKINGDGSASAPAVGEAADNEITAGLDKVGLEDETAPTQDGNDPKTAWVMAVYEDDAGNDRTWKRTINNQGASEYRINNRSVTAQQYNASLESENILIKARNFLVFQGDVEAIASQSPRDLTRLIEQISGSLEHKAAYEDLKEQAEDALENQNFALHRRRGINSEIKQYTDQKAEADNYAKRTKERDDSIVTHILWKLYHFQRTIEESGAEIQRYQEELKEQRRNVEQYDKLLEDARKDQAKVGREVSKVEKAIKEQERLVELKSNNLIPIAEKLEITTNSIKKCKNRVKEIATQGTSHATTVSQLTKDLKKIEKAEAQWEADFKKQVSHQGHELSPADLQHYYRLKGEVANATSEAQMKLDNLTRQLKSDIEDRERLQRKIEEMQAHSARLSVDKPESVQRKKTLNSDISQTTQELNAKKKAYNERTSERRRTAQLRTEKDEKLQEVLLKLLEAEDGRQQSDKELRFKATVSDMRRVFPGVRGRVNELCKPTEKRFELAVSTVLGRNFDAVIVDSEKIAVECIQYLREHRRGQATFIPLDTIQFTAAGGSLKGQQRGCRSALDTIKYDRSLERAYSYICGSAVVCDDLQIAKAVVWDQRNDVKAIALDGSIIHKGGNMTGGQGHKSHARSFDDVEIENLRKLQERLVSELSILPDTRRDAAEEQQLLGEVNSLENKLATLQEELKVFERNQGYDRKELAHVVTQLKESIIPEYEEKAARVAKAEQASHSAQGKIDQVRDSIFAGFCQRLNLASIAIYEAHQGTLQQEGAQRRLEFSTQKSRLQSRITYEEQQAEEINLRVGTLENRRQQDESLMQELSLERETIQDELDTVRARIEQLGEQVQVEKGRYEKKTSRVAEQRREVQRRSRDVESTLKTITGHESDRQMNASSRYNLLRRCKVEDIQIPLMEDSADLRKLPLDDTVQQSSAGPDTDADAMDVDEEEMANATLKVSDIQDYGIEVDFDGLDEDLRQSAGEDIETELQNRIRTLNNDLESMAPNMRAVERLGVVQDRLKLTDREFEEARRRAKKAKDAFIAIKEKRFELFSKAFAHISDQIDPIYKNLTREQALPMGGQAFLDMEDSDEPYLDGIKYTAMPPLKRFRDMEHLSGGEKTMAALALLFAIHSYQPSPFFVLDEVDAALDNANVAKIANYIRNHAGPGMQFIVISLKTGLFQNSETLVGIYRDQTANSSKALTLDLRKYQ